MNLRDVTKDEEVKNEKTTKEKDKTLENLDKIVLKINTENKIEELEEASKKLSLILSDFANKVPLYIEKLEMINKGLKIDGLYKNIREIKENSDIIIRIETELKLYNKSIFDKSYKIYEERLNQILNMSEKTIYQKGIFYKNLNKGLFIAVVLLILINLSSLYFYRKNVEEMKKENSQIHKILTNDEKYWIDKENYKVFLEKYGKK